MNTLTSRHVTPAHCAHLRHKGMYVAAELDPAMRAAYHEDLAPTAFWCSCTQKSFGPDGHPVTAELCQTGRSCCER